MKISANNFARIAGYITLSVFILAVLFFLVLNVERPGLIWDEPVASISRGDQNIINILIGEFPGLKVIDSTFSLYANESAIRSLPLVQQTTYFIKNRTSRFLLSSGPEKNSFVCVDLLRELMPENVSWAGFKEVFPAESGVIRFSTPCTMGKRAFATAVIRTPDLSAGYFFTLIKRNERWYIESRCLIWKNATAF